MIALTRWASKHTNFFFGVPGLVESLDLLAEKFVMARSDADKEKIIAEAEAIAPKVELKDKENAKYYIRVMKAIKEKGVSHIHAEIERLQGILDSERLSGTKKREMEKRLNIVHQFDRPQEEQEL
jgi:Endoplasmic reticulum protein ERp29, C-terminal domain